MSIDFATLQGLTIPEGIVTEIKDAAGNVIWSALGTSGNVILEVQKIVADTYAGSTKYTGEEFIILDIYPKSGGTVNVTYGGLTKTITDDGTSEDPNAQQVYFGTFYGVSDSVVTPASGILTIEGDYSAFSCGSSYKNDKYSSTRAWCVVRVVDWGGVEKIPDAMFGGLTYTNTMIVDAGRMPDIVTTLPGYMFSGCSNLIKIGLPNSMTSAGISAFSGCTSLKHLHVPKKWKVEPSQVSSAVSLTDFTVSADNEYHSAQNGVLFNKDRTELICCPKGRVDCIIPDGVTTIGGSALSGCSNVTNVTIPDSVTKIGVSAFNLKEGFTRTVTMRSTTPAFISSNTFDEVGTNNIIVPVGSGATYKAAAGWSNYADYITEG